MVVHAWSEPVVRIEATRISQAVASVLDTVRPARVLSVHRRAINLLLGNYLLTVGDATLGGLPNGVQAAGFEAARDSLRPGAWRDIRIDLSNAAVWSPRMRRIGVPVDLAARRRAAEDAALRLPNVGLLPLLRAEADDRAAGPAAAVIRAARRPAEGLRCALLRRDVEAVATAGAALIGLGYGLTPSGDDLLVGFAAALAAVGDPMALPLATRWAAEAERGTGLVALSFHRHAAAGEYSERIHDLLSAILAQPMDRIEPAVRRAACWGATSGGDTVVGVMCALSGIRA